MIINIKTKLYFVYLSIFIVLLDQITKYLMLYKKKIFINKDFLLLKLDFVKNYGAAFNIFSGSRIFLSLISIFFSILLIYLIFRKNTLNSFDLYSYSFILGGTIGNGIDRILKGYVIDFINLNIINFPVFNIADLSINIGFIFLLFNIFKKNRWNELLEIKVYKVYSIYIISLYFISISFFIILIDQFKKYLMFYNYKLFINKDFLFLD